MKKIDNSWRDLEFKYSLPVQRRAWSNMISLFLSLGKGKKREKSILMLLGLRETRIYSYLCSSILYNVELHLHMSMFEEEKIKEIKRQLTKENTVARALGYMGKKQYFTT